MNLKPATIVPKITETRGTVTISWTPVPGDRISPYKSWVLFIKRGPIRERNVGFRNELFDAAVMDKSYSIEMDIVLVNLRRLIGLNNRFEILFCLNYCKCFYITKFLSWDQNTITDRFCVKTMARKLRGCGPRPERDILYHSLVTIGPWIRYSSKQSYHSFIVPIRLRWPQFSSTQMLATQIKFA